MSKLGAGLKEFRGDQSLDEVEKATGVRRTEIKRYEAGQYAPFSSTLKKLAFYFDVADGELCKLYYDDFFSDCRERDIILQWAREAISSMGTISAGEVSEPLHRCFTL